MKKSKMKNKIKNLETKNMIREAVIKTVLSEIENFAEGDSLDISQGGKGRSREEYRNFIIEIFDSLEVVVVNDDIKYIIEDLEKRILNEKA